VVQSPSLGYCNRFDLNLSLLFKWCVLLGSSILHVQKEPYLRQVMIPGVRFYQTDFYVVNNSHKWQ